MAWHRTSGNNGGKLEVLTASGDIASFETNLVAPYQSVLVNVLATGGNGTPDNPNPINGYTEANITRCGVNLFDSNKFVSDYSTKYEIGTDGCVKQISTANIADVLWSNSFGQTGAFGIVFRVKYASTGTAGVRPCVNYTDGTKLYIYPTNTQDYAEYTVLTNSSKTVKDITTDFGTASNMTSFFLQLAVGENTTYHPYTGNAYTIAFGQTVYGGVLDVTRGKLRVTHTVALFDGTEVYSSYFPTVVCEKQFTKGSGTPVDMVCSHAPTVAMPNQWFGYANANNVKFEFRKVGDNWGCSDIDAFKTFIATQYANGTPLTILYPLETPFDIDLTPVQVEQILGKNNVWHDANGDTEVKYLEVVRN